jgi:hypothetical protein
VRVRTTTVALAFALVAAASGALAEPQTRTFYNEKGQEVGRAMTRGNTTHLFKRERTDHGSRRAPW